MGCGFQYNKYADSIQERAEWALLGVLRKPLGFSFDPLDSYQILLEKN